MRIYCPEPLAAHDVAYLFYFKYARERLVKNVFNEPMPPNFFELDVAYVALEEAQAVVLPNNFLRLTDEAQEYIARHADHAHRRGIPIFVFSLGDLTDGLRFDPRVRVFRVSAYRSSMSLQDIVIPTLTTDLGASGITLREKSDTPVVSFCGQAGYVTLRQWAGYFVKNMLLPSQRRLGVYWRRRMMAACRHSLLVTAKFIVRRSYSMAARTIELAPIAARRDFVLNVQESDFVLAPKGDGNYSNRFLEALSMGRIPVVPDTDIVLPLEHEIDYAKILVSVPMTQIKDTPRLIRAYYDSLSADVWRERQRLARETYERNLRQDAYFKKFFAELSV
jgi:hypothetical protein